MSNKTLYTNILGCLVKNGKKTKAETILSTALNTVSSKMKINTSRVFSRLSRKLGNIVELKKIKVKKNIHFVPFPLKTSRRRFLLSKELTSAIESNSKKVTASEKLSDQMLSYLTKRGSNFQKKKQYTKQIIANRSNAHYRW